VRSEPLENRLDDGQDIQTMQHLFPTILFADPVLINNPPVVAEVELPNGTLYDFRYNAYGELTKVTLPTGGIIEYTWGSGVPGTPSGVYPVGPTAASYGVYRRVLSRKLTNWDVFVEQYQEFQARRDLCAVDGCPIEV